MRLYNPFRWHVIAVPDGTFAIRRLFIGWWQYYDVPDCYVWNGWRYGSKYCRIPNKERAIEVCKDLRTCGHKKVWP